MIHYHGGPITPNSAAIACWTGRHAFVSFEYDQQVDIAAEVCQSFAFDNGAFSVWKRGRALDVEGYKGWCERWQQHPGFDWALIPDAIEGSEAENDALIADWPRSIPGVPVYHLHESIERARRLSCSYRRIAIGSSGQWPDPGTPSWWRRMDEVMRAVCHSNGRPRCKLHGLRMLSTEIFSRLPFASADSTNIARNIGIDSRWSGAYSPANKEARALILASRIEAAQSAPVYEFDRQMGLSIPAV